MFELIGLAIGAFLGYLAADFLAVLDPIRATVRQSIATAREKGMQLVAQKAGPAGQNPLFVIGALLVLVVLLIWLLGFSSAMLLGVVLGIVYQEEVGRLPFISGIAENLRNKISGRK